MQMNQVFNFMDYKLGFINNQINFFVIGRNDCACRALFIFRSGIDNV